MNSETVYSVLAAAAVVLLPIVVILRRRSHWKFLNQFADKEVCEHLHEALDLLKSRGHRIVRAGQKDPELPLEIHMSPPFDPQAMATELKLVDPVFVSERNVLYCREHWCELHPVN